MRNPEQVGAGNETQHEVKRNGEGLRELTFAEWYKEKCEKEERHREKVRARERGYANPSWMNGDRGREQTPVSEASSDEGIPRDEDFRIDTPDKEEAWAGILERRKEIPKDEDFRVDTPDKEKAWAGLAESLKAIDEFKEEKAREVSEKLKRHERAKKGLKRFIKKGLAMAAAAFVTIASSRVAGAGAEMFANKTQPTMESFDEGTEAATSGAVDLSGGLSVDLSGGTETEAETPAVDLAGLQAEAEESDLVDMQEVPEVNLGQESEDVGKETEASIPVDLAGAQSDETSMNETKKFETELSSALSGAAMDYDFDAIGEEAMTWDEFVEKTNLMNEDAPFEITTSSEAEQYRANDDGTVSLINQTTGGGKIVKG